MTNQDHQPDTAAGLEAAIRDAYDAGWSAAWADEGKGSGPVETVDEVVARLGGLIPAESIALTVGLAQVQRGEEPMPNVATVCILALARLDGRYDWSAKEEADAG